MLSRLAPTSTNHHAAGAEAGVTMIDNPAGFHTDQAIADINNKQIESTLSPSRLSKRREPLH